MEQMTQGMIAELYNIYHLARTALADKPLNRRTPYDRKLYAAREFNKIHPGISQTRAYLAFERTDAGVPA